MRAAGRRPGALSLLSAALLPVVGAVAVQDPMPGVIVLAAQAVGLGWLVLDWRAVGRRIPFGLVAAVSIGGATWLYGRHDLPDAAAAALRVLCVVVPAALVTPSIRPSELGDQLAQRLHLPARQVVAATAALQRLDDLGDQWRQIRRARRARGLDLHGGPLHGVAESGRVAFALLVVALRQSSALAVAMDARGFARSAGRTWAEPAVWTALDWLVLLIAVGLAVLPWLLNAWVPV